MTGVNIQPIQAWFNGQQIEINYFTQNSIFDNLDSRAIMYYQMQNVDKTDPLKPIFTTISEGELTIDGPDYAAWNIDTNANQWIYNWSLNQLNLTQIP